MAAVGSWPVPGRGPSVRSQATRRSLRSTRIARSDSPSRTRRPPTGPGRLFRQALQARSSGVSTLSRRTHCVRLGAPRRNARSRSLIVHTEAAGRDLSASDREPPVHGPHRPSFPVSDRTFVPGACSCCRSRSSVRSNFVGERRRDQVAAAARAPAPITSVTLVFPARAPSGVPSAAARS